MSLDIDMAEIQELFLEESFEGLDIMETGLLNLDLEAADEETVNDIFRAAHSIKGGAATLGHMEVSNFTHGMETLLDEIRSGARAATAESVNLLLRGVDHLRVMLTAIRNDESADAASGEELQAEITAMLESGAQAPAEDDGESQAPAQSENEAAAEPPPNATPPNVQVFDQPAAPPATVPAEGEWEIRFSPHATLFAHGNDPLRIFRELGRLGELQVQADTSGLPAFDAMQPEHSYLSWTLRLQGGMKREDIDDVFEWVVDECDLSIRSLTAADSPPLPAETASVSAATEPAQTPAPAAEPNAAQQAPAAAATAAASGKRKQASNRESTSIRVSTEKVDTLLNLCGELVITQSMLRRFGNEDVEISVEELRDGLLQLERHTRELQESVMQIRMLPISFCFSRFPRLVHDLSRKLGKKIDLQLVGQQTELDKTVLEKIGDPLVHLVRNSLDHGIESTEERIAAGKPETGVIRLSASQEGGNIVIQVSDDGAGLNRDRILAKARERGIVASDEALSDERIYNLVFAPGFSTADVVSDVSGRGVGMDVVRSNINDLGGRVDVQSDPGKGSVFTIRLPLTLAILDGQIVRVGSETYIVPLLSIVETVQLRSEQIHVVSGRGRVYRLRDTYIPVVRLADSFSIAGAGTSDDGGLLVVVEADGEQIGVFVDELLDQQQVVIKSLEENYQQVDGLAGATILGDGTVALILDVPGLSSYVKGRDAQRSRAA